MQGGNKDNMPSKKFYALLPLLLLQRWILAWYFVKFFLKCQSWEMQNTTLYIFFTCNPADVSTTHFKFVFKCIINSIFPSSPKLPFFVGFLKYYCTECHIDFTVSLSETYELPLPRKYWRFGFLHFDSWHLSVNKIIFCCCCDQFEVVVAEWCWSLYLSPALIHI